jgi:hypothetical protein
MRSLLHRVQSSPEILKCYQIMLIEILQLKAKLLPLCLLIFEFHVTRVNERRICVSNFYEIV